MNFLRMTAVMLRYRVAALLLPFFLLAPAEHASLASFRWTYVAGLVALLASYLVATCLNDVYDYEVDRINHPRAKDRPLVSGEATPGTMLAIASVSGVVAFAAALSIGPLAVALIAASLLLNVAYSVPPIRLCAKPVPAPLILGFAYAVLPYGIGLAAAGARPTWSDALLAFSFMILFAGRMLLKDFRDRRGDVAFGKRTFLVAYGKEATLIAVFVCVIVGNALLLASALSNVVLVAVTQTYFVAILIELRRLWRASAQGAELLAIARGARMGNAVVLTWLGFVLLRSAGASPAELAALVIAIATMFWFGFLVPSAPPAAASSPA